MGRVINTNEPGKRRSYHMRTIAEIVRALGQKQTIDDDVRDMCATIVLSLRDIHETVEESIKAWEKRNYWKKADDFQEQWYWASQTADQLEKLIREENWDELPTMMMRLYPRIADIEINKSMRSADDWVGNYDRLLNV
ncbi:hypothetical protein VZO05_04135 [Aggregatilineales bacterium SYSU G02658]